MSHGSAEAHSTQRLSEAWRAEVASRVARIDAGETELLDVEDVERELWSEQLADEAAEQRP